MHQGKFQSTLKLHLRRRSRQGILEEVKEHTDWVNSYVFVEKDTGNHHSPNHTVKKKLKICLDPRDLNEALERELYHTHSAEEITAKFPSRDRMEISDISQHPWKCAWMTASLLLQRRPNKSHSKAKPLSNAVQHTAFQKNTVLSYAEFSPGMESMPFFPGKQFLQGKEKFTLPDIENMPFFLGNQFLQGKKKSTLGTKLKPFVDTCTFTLGTDQQPFVETDQKPSTSSKDTHKKGRMTATIGMTGITPRTANKITTHILMSSQP